MRVAFFHGLNANPISEKTEILNELYDDVYSPQMDYTDPTLFNRVLLEILENRPKYLIGSSMGGYFAYCLSSITGIPTILFNPAMHSRSIEPVTQIGTKKSKHTIILGKRDQVVNPSDTINWLTLNTDNVFKYNVEDFEHRVPRDIFIKYVNIK